MEKIFITITSVIIIFIALSQSLQAEIKSRIVFNDGKKISGVILKPNSSDSVRIQLGAGFITNYAKKDIKDIVLLRNDFSLGIGIGIPYAMFGACLEIEPIPQVDLTAGIGTSILDGIAWDVGAVVYLLDQDNTFRPRISLIYGTNTYIELKNSSGGSSEYEMYAGLSIGGGLKFMLGDSHGMTLDAFFIIVDGSKDRQDELKRHGYTFSNQGIPVKFSIGYQFSF